uniref:Extracellular calcium-sensing receptor-like n=1 Tax=Erpetoichthys calabaricus TaxID=27687 RepID=A0A8C4TE36_ERPCA
KRFFLYTYYSCWNEHYWVPLTFVSKLFSLYGLYKKGDIMLGGIFPVQYFSVPPELSFRSKPDKWKCDNLDFSGFQSAQTMAYAVDEINRNVSLLPNITLGYWLYDNCIRMSIGLRAATALISGQESVVSDYSCNQAPPVVALVGDTGSSPSIAISRILSLFGMPMVSYFATCPCLSNKVEFPSFFRTIPSDDFQVKAMVEIIKHFGWTWVGILGSDDEYGHTALKTFSDVFQTVGCLSFNEIIPQANDKLKILHITNIIKQSTAKVIVIFAVSRDISFLLNEIILQNITGRQWIASEAWSLDSLASEENFYWLGGTIGIAIRRKDIPNLEKFLLQVRPDFDPANNLVIRFWETMFECKFPENSSTLINGKTCTGSEDLKSLSTAYTDTSQLRSAYNVYKSVYALAHALHDLMMCKKGEGPFENGSCADIFNVQPWQVLFYMRKVNFINPLGERVAFDKNGDALGIYDIVNWQKINQGKITIKTVGVYDESVITGKALTIQDNEIFWNFPSKLAPESICSKSCQPGTRKASRKGEPVCCFDCVPCAEGEISTVVDSSECFRCPSDFWSNPGRNQCVEKEVEFLSFEESMGITLTTIAALGICVSFSVLAVFIHFRETAVVKANNSELSYFLLVSLALCFLCSLFFIGEPSHVTCRLRHVAFGISFVLCISCLLVKTVVVIIAFKATVPGNNRIKWFGAVQQRGTVFFFTSVETLICILWLVISPPVPAKNTNSEHSKIILECNVGSVTGFACVLGYIFFLACVCFVLAFLARNLPDSFNEAKFITFSMIIFLAVWIAFIPAYVSSPGKYTIAVEIFAILASSFGLLMAIFTPKCYIILLKPELNNKRSLMGRSTNNKNTAQNTLFSIKLFLICIFHNTVTTSVSFCGNISTKRKKKL